MMVLQAPGSVVVGVLLDSGVTFDAIFQLMAGTLLIVFATLVVLHVDGRLPSSAEA
jgi:hypothetical protein